MKPWWRPLPSSKTEVIDLLHRSALSSTRRGRGLLLKAGVVLYLLKLVGRRLRRRLSQRRLRVVRLEVVPSAVVRACQL